MTTHSRHESNRSKGASALVIVATLLGSLAPSASYADDLVMWNKLGSVGEVLNSEIGPDGTVVGSNFAFEPAMFGNGYVRKATGQEFVQFPGSILHALKERGTIELWIVPKVPNPVPFQFGLFALVGVASTGPMAPLDRGNVYLCWGDGFTGRGFFGGVQFDSMFAQTPDESSQFVAPVGVPVHAAICWDIDGIDATTDKVRVYRDGQVVGATSASWNPNGTVLQERFWLGQSPDAQGFDKWISDNIKVRDFAKTDFSDRFEEGSVVLNLDIKPGSCPNSFNRHSHGVLPVALLDTESFDVSEVDLSTVTISRADGVGGSVGPNEGPPGPHSEFEDVGTPFDGELCDCHEAAGDGFIDLSMKFRTDDVVAALELDALPPGDLVELTVSGELLDGTPFEASDCVRLVPPGTALGLVSVVSGAANRWLDVQPLDLVLDGGGFGTFERVYPVGSVIVLEAPASTVTGMVFDAWVVDGIRKTTGMRTLQMTVVSEVHDIRSIYKRVETNPGRPPRQQTTDIGF